MRVRLVLAVLMGAGLAGSGLLAVPAADARGVGPAQGSVLADVSCPSATVCLAVGSQLTSTNHATTLAELWNGSSWSILATPNAPTTDSELEAVSCAPLSKSCMAVGDDLLNTALALRWNGTAWGNYTPENPPGYPDAGFTGVTCTAVFSCVAVGTASTSHSAGVPLA
jgi:hypothetical protein